MCWARAVQAMGLTGNMYFPAPLDRRGQKTNYVKHKEVEWDLCGYGGRGLLEPGFAGHTAEKLMETDDAAFDIPSVGFFLYSCYIFFTMEG